ncbi:MAG: hypothetical protein QXI58_01450 [Candidatus Micrarchaeia archaeon]
MDLINKIKINEILPIEVILDDSSEKEVVFYIKPPYDIKFSVERLGDGYYKISDLGTFSDFLLKYNYELDDDFGFLLDKFVSGLKKVGDQLVMYSCENFLNLNIGLFITTLLGWIFFVEVNEFLDKEWEKEICKDKKK